MMSKSKDAKYLASDLVIVQKHNFPVLASNPIDAIDDGLYARLEKLTSWFVLRAPLSQVTKLANLGSIALFKTEVDSSKGARAKNRAIFDETFLVPYNLDCTQFEFVYKRVFVKLQMSALDLPKNDDGVFQSTEERAVCFVGKGDEGSKEDSCIESICRHIRNAFAHGRIAIKRVNNEPFIFLEDGITPRDVEYLDTESNGPKHEIRFRMLARIPTLESWHRVLIGN